MDANSRVVSGGAAFGASRISDSLRRSDDHPAAGDMPRTHRDCTQQRAEAASARETHCAYPERAERATAELTIAGGPKVRIISVRQRVSDEPWAADQGHPNVPRGASPFLPLAKPSGKVPETHSVGSICDHDFGVFTNANSTIWVLPTMGPSCRRIVATIGPSFSQGSAGRRRLEPAKHGKPSAA